MIRILKLSGVHAFLFLRALSLFFEIFRRMRNKSLGLLLDSVDDLKSC